MGSLDLTGHTDTFKMVVKMVVKWIWARMRAQKEGTIRLEEGQPEEAVTAVAKVGGVVFDEKVEG